MVQSQKTVQFLLGQTVMTRGVADLVAENEEFAPEPVTAGITEGVTSTENPPDPETTGTPKKQRGRRKKT